MNDLDPYLMRFAEALQVPVRTITLNVHARGKYAVIDTLDGFLYHKGEVGGTHFYLKIGDKIVTSFKLLEFPHCCAFCISAAVVVYTEYRGKGINIIANQLRQALAKAAGFTALVCTDVVDNAPQRKTLRRNGWSDVFQTVNRRTKRLVAISVKYLE